MRDDNPDQISSHDHDVVRLKSSRPFSPINIPSSLFSQPRRERKAVDLKGLTREQVDPDFKGTPLEFATKYGTSGSIHGRHHNHG
jgi:hypothetical protein